jgi:hypothetical protein
MDAMVEDRPHELTSPPFGTPLLLVGLVVSAGLGWHFLHYLWHAIGAIRYPFELDHGEGIVWQQALLIPSATKFPFFAFQYPPVYHLAVRVLAATGIDMLVAGRSISLVSALTVGTIVARLAFLATPRRVGSIARFTGSAIAGLTVFCYEPVVTWSPLMRVDMLAVALSFLGVLCVVTSVGRLWRLIAGLVFFLLAMFTSQTSIAAPLATIPVMLIIDPRRTLATSSAMVLAGLALLLLLNEYTGGGFLRHILLHGGHRYQFDLLIYGIAHQWHHAVFLLFTVAGVVSVWRRLASEGRWLSRGCFIRDVAGSIDTRCMLVVTFYLIVTTLMLVMIGRSGAGANYLIEGMCVWSVIIGAFVASTIDRTIRSVALTRQSLAAPVAISLGWLLAMQMIVMPTSNGEYGIVTQAYTRDLELLRSRIAKMPGPVLSDDMVLLLRAGKQVSWEPASFVALAGQRRWDRQMTIDRIQAHEFATIVTSGGPGGRLYDSRFTPDVTHAIEAAYPRTESMAGRTLHLPPG